MADKFEDTIHKGLHQYLAGMKLVDERLQECPDVEERWPSIGNSYIPDGARELPHQARQPQHRSYPAASLGWMMVQAPVERAEEVKCEANGMAVAKMWDDEWSIYSQIEDLYLYMRDKRGYDEMDEYIREDVLMLRGKESDELEKVVSECATRVNYDLIRQGFEPGTKEAFDGYVACLHQLYLFGAAMQLHRMGYHMERLN